MHSLGSDPVCVTVIERTDVFNWYVEVVRNWAEKQWLGIEIPAKLAGKVLHTYLAIGLYSIYMYIELTHIRRSLSFITCIITITNNG